MTSFTPLSGAEARMALEIQRRLIRKRPNREQRHWTKDLDPINNASWPKVWVAHNLVYAAISYVLNGSGGWPARPNLPDIEHYLDPFLWCMKSRGAKDIIISINWDDDPAAERQDSIPFYCRCSLDGSAIEEACEFLAPKHGTYVGIPSGLVMAFDETEEWAICDASDEIHLLSGTPEFMSQYYSAAGGEDYVRAWFYHWEICELSEYREDVGLPNRIQAQQYDYAGWPYPVYPKNRMGPENGMMWSQMFGDRIKSVQSAK